MSEAVAAGPTSLPWRWGLRLLGPVILAFALWRFGGAGALLDQLGGLLWAPLLLGMALNVVNVVLKTFRWTQLLETRDVRYSFGPAVKAVLASLFLGMVTPGRVGDVLRIRYLKKDRAVGYADGAASVIVDRLSDVWVLGVLVALSALWLHTSIAGDVAPWLWAGVVASLAGPLLIFKMPQHPAWSRAQPLVRAIRSYGLWPLVDSLPLTVATFGITLMQGYLFARALGIELAFLDVAALVCIANLLALLPISVSGMGVREAFFAMTVPSLGVPAGQGVALGLILFIGVYAVIALLGFISWLLWPPPTT